jgi:hypothetical protein
LSVTLASLASRSTASFASAAARPNNKTPPLAIPGSPPPLYSDHECSDPDEDCGDPANDSGKRPGVKLKAFR